MRIKVQLREDWTPEDSKESFAKGAILDLEKNEALMLIGDDKADRYREPVEPDKAKGADDPDAWKKPASLQRLYLRAMAIPSRSTSGSRTTRNSVTSTPANSTRTFSRSAAIATTTGHLN